MPFARHALILSLFAATSVLAQGGFPEPPVNLKEAEGQGLQRLSVEDLKAFIPGTHDTKGTKGKSTRTFKPDGSYERKAFQDFSGSWRFDEGKNAYCLDVRKKKGTDMTCFAVFRAKEGNYYFDYDLENGFYAHSWTPAKTE
ncbi:MAG: hypothetical protein GC183_13115 [Thiobacillus sp.]|nr:hypothetical protein [Thiobacillus sp.]